jgi:hypothetical protein
VGRKTATFKATVERGKVKEFAAALGETHDLFWLDDREGGLSVPPTISHIFRSGKMQLLMGDCGLDATKFLHGEHDITYMRPLRVGEEITYSIEVVKVEEKSGRRSGPMDVVSLDTVIRDADDAVVQVVRQTFVAKR